MKTNCYINKGTYEYALHSHSHREKETELDTPGYIYVINNKEIASLKVKLSQLEETMRNFPKLQSDYRIVSNSITSLNESIIHYRIGIHKLTQKNDKELEMLNQMNKVLKNKNNDQQTEKRILKEDQKNIQFHLDQALDKKDIYEKKLKAKDNEIDEFSNEIIVFRNKINDLELSLNKDNLTIMNNKKIINNENSNWDIKSNHINEMTKMNNDIENQINELLNQKKEAKDKMIKTEKELKHQNEDIISQNKKNYDSSNQINTKTSFLQQIIHELKDKQSELNKIRDVNASLKRDIGIKENDVAVQQNTNEAFRDHLEQLNNNYQSLTQELRKAEKVLCMNKDKADILIKQNKIFSSELETVVESDSLIKEQLSNDKEIEDMISKTHYEEEKKCSKLKKS